jgi:hypothetical protein
LRLQRDRRRVRGLRRKRGRLRIKLEPPRAVAAQAITSAAPASSSMNPKRSAG